MTDPTNHHLDLTVGFKPRPPKPPKRHAFRDCFLIVMAAAFMAAALGNSTALFAILSAIGIAGYVIQSAIAEARNPVDKDNRKE